MSAVIIQHQHAIVREAPENARASFIGIVSLAMVAHLRKVDVSFVRTGTQGQDAVIEFYQGMPPGEIRTAIKSIFSPI